MPITVEQIDTWIVEVPTIRRHVLSMTSIRTQVMALVFVRCSDGSVGLGEGTTIGGMSYSEESPESIKLAIDRYFRPLLVNQDADNTANLMSILDNNIVRNHFAKNAIETALLDAAAQRKGVSLASHLGGARRSSLAVAWTLASGSTQTDIEEAEAMLEQRRHNAFKLKIGRQPFARDIAHVAEIAKAIGDRASIRVDINQAWDEQQAIRGAKLLAEIGVGLIEQPIDHYNRRGMAKLASASPIAIMADEGLHGPFDAFELAHRNCANAFSIKPPQAGGLLAAREVASIARAAHIGLYGGTMLEGSVGTIAAAHLFATLPSLEWGTELFGPLLLTEELLQEPLVYSDFSLTLPTGAGLGIELDIEKVQRFRIDQSPPSLFPVTAQGAK